MLQAVSNQQFQNIQSNAEASLFSRLPCYELLIQLINDHRLALRPCIISVSINNR